MHLEPTQESVQQVFAYLPEGPFVMLNLFRLRDLPDYSAHPELKPATPSSCRELLYRYIANMDRYLAKVGAERIFLADGGPAMVGPPGERWDVVQKVRYPSRQALIDLAMNEEVQAEVPLRAVMLEDSRVMPMLERSLELAGS